MSECNKCGEHDMMKDKLDDMHCDIKSLLSFKSKILGAIIIVTTIMTVAGEYVFGILQGR